MKIVEGCQESAFVAMTWMICFNSFPFFSFSLGLVSSRLVS